ncbi:hypothetical protein Tco_0605599 [Tanacetum coccineum]
MLISKLAVVGKVDELPLCLISVTELGRISRSPRSRFLVSKPVTNAKFGSLDGGFVISVVGGGVGVDCGSGGVKDGNDCGMTVVYIVKIQ